MRASEQIIMIGGSDGLGSSPAYRQITGFVQYATQLISNGSSFTQIQSRKSFFVNQAFSALKITIGNLLQTNTAETSLPDATWRVGIFDPATGVTYPVTFAGSAAITLTSGQLATSDPVACAIATAAAGVYPGGKQLFVLKYVTYATAPANFPASRFVQPYTDYNEWGNSLTDKTTGLGGAWTASRPAGNFDPTPIVAISGLRARVPVVAIWGDSISSDFVGDTLNDYLNGWTVLGLSFAGIPHIDVGVSSLALASLMSQTAKRARIRNIMQAAGVTHCLCPLVTNDWAIANGPQTAAQVYANLGTLKTELDGIGVNLIPTTAQPKTNATNDGQNGSEVNTFTERATFNSTIISNNGVGYGYFDVAGLTQNSGSPTLWRTDLNTVSAMTVNAAGANYVVNDLLNLPSGVRALVASVSSGAVATVTLRRGGASVATMPATASQVSGLNAATSSGWSLGGNTAGSGAVFNQTNSAVGIPTSDGIHPSAPMHAYIAFEPTNGFAAKAPTLFT